MYANISLCKASFSGHTSKGMGQGRGLVWGAESILIWGNLREFKQKRITAVISHSASMRHGRAADTIDFYYTFCLNWVFGAQMQNYFCQVLITPKKVCGKKNFGIGGSLVWIVKQMNSWEYSKQRKYLEGSEQSILADLKGEYLYYYIIIIIIIINTLKYFGFKLYKYSGLVVLMWKHSIVFCICFKLRKQQQKQLLVYILL